MARTATDPDPSAPRASRWLGLLSRPLGALYGLGARLHRAGARRFAGRRGQPRCAIVSVGGLTVGGAGKTPTAARLARRLAARGHRVVLASRGYGGHADAPVTVVSDGARVHAALATAGDESLVLAAHAPGVPVLVGRDRRVVGHHAVAAFGAEILVLDDGFQHHRLRRDFDLVCLDGHAGIGNGRVLPAGPLREPLSALRFADAVCVVDGPPDAALPEAVAAALPDAAWRLRAARRPVALAPLGEGPTRALSELDGARVGVFAGIARPAALRRTVEALGAEVVAERAFPDHHVYAAGDLAFIGQGDAPAAGQGARPDRWITTEKDAPKILPVWVPEDSVSVLRIEVELEDEAVFLDRLVARLREVGRLAEN